MSKASMAKYRSVMRALFGSGKAYYPALAKVFGGGSAAIMLSQLLYWSFNPTAEERGGEFWKTRKELFDETGLSLHEQATAQRRLKGVGIVSCKLKGVPRRTWYQVDLERLAVLVHEYDQNGKRAINQVERKRDDEGKFIPKKARV